MSTIVSTAPMRNEEYDTLKRRILTEFTDSGGKRVNKLLSIILLGDSKPSALIQQRFSRMYASAAFLHVRLTKFLAKFVVAEITDEYSSYLIRLEQSITLAFSFSWRGT